MISGVVGGARAWVGRRSRGQRAGAVAGVALVATAPFGGLEPAPADPLATVTAGEAITVGPFEVTIERVVSIPDLEPVAAPEVEGNRLIGVVAQVTNTTDRPEGLGLLEDGLRVSGAGIADASAPQLFVVMDGSSPRTLNPGMGEEMVVILEHAPDRGDRVRVDVRGYTYLEVDSLGTSGEYWREGDVVASGELPVVERD